MKPTIIDNNFLDQDELEDIKTKVFMLKDHWSAISDQLKTKTVLLSKILPAGVYSKNYSEQEISNNKKIMYEQFSYYYDKIKNKLSSYFNVPIDYSSTLQYPGFHIFVNNNGDNAVTKPHVNFHLDRFPKLKKVITIKKIESVIIPITLPSNDGYLLWNDSGRRNPDNRFSPEMPSDKRFYYTPGMIATWPGELQHSIGPFTLKNSSESRITMQMHINLESDHGTIFW